MGRDSSYQLACYLSSEFITGPLLGELCSMASYGLFCFVLFVWGFFFFFGISKVLNVIHDASQGMCFK